MFVCLLMWLAKKLLPYWVSLSELIQQVRHTVAHGAERRLEQEDDQLPQCKRSVQIDSVLGGMVKSKKSNSGCRYFRILKPMLFMILNFSQNVSLVECFIFFKVGIFSTPKEKIVWEINMSKTLRDRTQNFQFSFST